MVLRRGQQVWWVASDFFCLLVACMHPKSTQPRRHWRQDAIRRLCALRPVPARCTRGQP